MVNDLKRRLKALEATASGAIIITAAEIVAAVARYSAEPPPPECPTVDAFGAMLRSMRPATARLFINIHPMDLML